MLELAVLGFFAVLLLRKKSVPEEQPVSEARSEAPPEPQPTFVEQIVQDPNVQKAAGAGGLAAVSALGIAGVAAVGSFVAAGGLAIASIVDAVFSANARSELWASRVAATDKLAWDAGNVQAWITWMREAPRGVFIFADGDHSFWGMGHGKYWIVGMGRDLSAAGDPVGELHGDEAWFLFADGYLRRYGFKTATKDDAGLWHTEPIAVRKVDQHVVEVFGLKWVIDEGEAPPVISPPPPPHEVQADAVVGPPPPAPSSTVPAPQATYTPPPAPAEVTQIFQPITRAGPTVYSPATPSTTQRQLTSNLFALLKQGSGT